METQSPDFSCTYSLQGRIYMGANKPTNNNTLEASEGLVYEERSSVNSGLSEIVKGDIRSLNLSCLIFKVKRL